MNTMPTHPTLTHPVTGAPLRAIYVSEKTGRVYWPILGGSGPAGGEGGGQGGDGGTGGGAPPAPPADNFTPITSQDELNRILEQRLNRERARFADYDTLKEKADKHDALELELSTDMQRTTLQASEDGYSAAMAVAIPRLVQAEFRAAAKGVLSDEQLATYLEGRDLAYFTFDDGEPDVVRIEEAVQKIARPGTSTAAAPPGSSPFRTLGQGQQPPVVVKPGEAGKAMAEKRFAKQRAAAAK